MIGNKPTPNAKEEAVVTLKMTFSNLQHPILKRLMKADSMYLSLLALYTELRAAAKYKDDTVSQKWLDTLYDILEGYGVNLDDLDEGWGDAEAETKTCCREN